VWSGPWYVKKSLPSKGGLSWSTAFGTLQEGVDAAFDAGGGEVFVAGGVYDELRDNPAGSLILREGCTCTVDTRVSKRRTRATRFGIRALSTAAKRARAAGVPCRHR